MFKLIDILVDWLQGVASVNNIKVEAEIAALEAALSKKTVQHQLIAKAERELLGNTAVERKLKFETEEL